MGVRGMRDLRAQARRDVAVVMPSLQPSPVLLEMVRELHLGGCSTIVIVDDGSGPDYQPIFDEAAQVLGCHVLTKPANQGKGSALRAAFAFILDQLEGVTVVVTADADGQHLVQDVLRCADRALELPGSIMVLGSRNFGAENVPLRSRFGNIATHRLLALLCGVHVSDTQTGLRAMSRETLPGLLEVTGDRFEYETNVLVDARRMGMSLTEIPVTTVYLDSNRSSHFRPFVDSWRIYSRILRFGTASAASAVIDIGIFTTLVSAGHLGSGSRILEATIVARLISSTVNYILNRRVFHVRSNYRASWWRYATLAGGIMLTSGLLVQALHSTIGSYPSVIKIFVDGMLFFVCYALQQKWVFPHREAR